MEEYDLNIDHYTIPDLLSILDQDIPTTDSVTRFIQDKLEEYENNPDLIHFFNQMKDKLLNHLDKSFTTTSTNKDSSTVKVFNTEVKKGNMNPDITNSIQRVINIDSFYRETIELNNQNTDNYTVRLTEPIHNVLSLTLMSVEIPYSWYTFTSAKGTTGCVISTFNSSGDIVTFNVAIPDGNYTNLSLLSAFQVLLNTKLSTIQNADSQTYTEWWIFQQDPVTGLLNVIPKSNVVNSERIYFPYDIKLLWFDVSYDIDVLMNSSVNSNLGWLLGFRYESTVLFKSEFGQIPLTIIAPCLMNTNGTKYIIMKINDYKSNRINNGLITNNNNTNEQIQLPSYLSANIQQSKYTYSKNIIKTFPNAPRQLTSKQLFTINSISEHNIASITKVRITPFNDSDIFAKIPLKQGSAWSSYNTSTNTNSVINNGPGNLFIEYSGPIQKNIREYFGPVTISSLNVSLYDDKGQILGLNGMDWSFTLNAKCLYSY
jgi:hypothetical protein